MIRLIDVDKLEHEYEQFNYYLTYSDCLEELRKAPLVKAIPIQWLEKMDSWHNHDISVREAIDLWERLEQENGI